MFINEAIRARLAFEVQFQRFRSVAEAVGLPPPSREVILEEARRDPHRTALEVLRDVERDLVRKAADAQ